MNDVKWLLTDEQLNFMIARLPGVKRAIKAEATKRGATAKRTLATHRHEGDAEVNVIHARGGVDSYVVLSDERGQRAAAAIEYGRGPWRRVPNDKRRVVGHVGSFPVFRTLRYVGPASGVGVLKSAMR